MKLMAHIGTDGILQIQTHTEFKDKSVEVLVVVQPLDIVAERLNRMTKEQSEEAINLLQSLLIQVDMTTDANALYSTLKLARREGLAAYDAAYLELVLRLKLPLATLDNRLAEAAIRCGVSLIIDKEISE